MLKPFIIWVISCLSFNVIILSKSETFNCSVLLPILALIGIASFLNFLYRYSKRYGDFYAVAITIFLVVGYFISLLLISQVPFLSWTQLTNKEVPVQVAPPPKKINEQILFDFVQKYRYENYLTTYKKSDFLCKIAEQRLQQIKADFSHTVFLSAHFCDNCTLAENLAKDYFDENILLLAWLKSPSHATILKAPYTYSCLRTDGNNTVQIFGYF